MTALSHPAATLALMLTDADRAILDLERLTWRHAGSKERAMREQLGLTSTEYYRRLGRIINDPAALAAEPVLVNRLRRMRTTGRLSRRAG